MLHVKIEISNCYEETDMFFVNQATSSFVTIFTDNPSEPVLGNIFFYDDVFYIGDMDIKLCQPIITNFNTTLAGGIGQQLAIIGKHFGTNRGSGQVYLKDVQQPASSQYIKTLDNVDYIAWSDTEIRLRIPTQVWASQSQFGYLPIAGSGPFMVKTDLGDSVFSSAAIDVRYTVNTTDTSVGKLRYNLINDNDSGSYTFYLDTSISNHPIRKAIVARAIHDWNCRTEVNWSLGPDTTLQQTAPDGVNVIYFDPTLTGSTLAETRRNDAFLCGTTSGNKAYFTDVDMRISANLIGTGNPSSYWWYDTTGANVPANAFDFYGVILHELGHAHALNHVNDPGDPMYIVTPIGPYPASNRHFNVSKWYNLVDGGVDVVTHSESLQYTGNCASTKSLVSAIEPGCTIIDPNLIAEYMTESNINVYPNPSNGTLFLKSSSNDLRKISLINMSGHQVQLVDFNVHHQTQDNFIFELDISNIASGVYVISIESDLSIESEKLIIQ